jgi:exo-1,4-beta-D-glucosaminidase
MACLLGIGVYQEDELFYSDNLNSVDWGMFRVPFLYRNEFALEPRDRRHYVLHTHGITSAADIYLNGELVADQTTQSGSYSGQNYDITGLVTETNVLLVKTYPTDYYQDLALGFIDWNPRPPDNGSGIWRDVEIRQTGPVFIEKIAAIVNSQGSVNVRATVRNLEQDTIKVTLIVNIEDPEGSIIEKSRHRFYLEAGQVLEVDDDRIIDQPRLWWPKQWGQQPLYKASVSAKVDCEVSDHRDVTFGIRTVDSHVNEHEDITFTVNGEPFQVRGAGYAPDMFLRWDAERFETIIRYMLDMGLNTIRLEGHLEHPELYEIADRLGLMVMAGWQCCNKW